MAETTTHSVMKEIMDLRWKFDQESAKMNQAIYNNQQDLIHDSTLKTISVLFEILARTEGKNQKP